MSKIMLCLLGFVSHCGISFASSTQDVYRHLFVEPKNNALLVFEDATHREPPFNGSAFKLYLGQYTAGSVVLRQVELGDVRVHVGGGYPTEFTFKAQGSELEGLKLRVAPGSFAQIEDKSQFLLAPFELNTQNTYFHKIRRLVEAALPNADNTQASSRQVDELFRSLANNKHLLPHEFQPPSRGLVETAYRNRAGVLIFQLKVDHAQTNYILGKSTDLWFVGSERSKQFYQLRNIGQEGEHLNRSFPTDRTLGWKGVTTSGDWRSIEPMIEFLANNNELYINQGLNWISRLANAADDNPNFSRLSSLEETILASEILDNNFQLHTLRRDLRRPLALLRDNLSREILYIDISLYHADTHTIRVRRVADHEVEWSEVPWRSLMRLNDGGSLDIKLTDGRTLFIPTATGGAVLPGYIEAVLPAVVRDQDYVKNPTPVLVIGSGPRARVQNLIQLELNIETLIEMGISKQEFAMASAICDVDLVRAQHYPASPL